MRAYRFTDPDVPASIKDTKVWRLASRLGHGRCFYTGVECLFYATDHGLRGRMDLFPQAATREHLIPKNRCRLNDREGELNVVIASSWMNNLVGNAPLSVKLEVREAIQACLEDGILETDDGDLQEDIRDCLTVRTSKVLDQYRIGRKYPWQLSSFTRAHEKKAAALLMESMAEWEHQLFREHFLVEDSPFWLPLGVSDI